MLPRFFLGLKSVRQEELDSGALILREEGNLKMAASVFRTSPNPTLGAKAERQDRHLEREKTPCQPAVYCFAGAVRVIDPGAQGMAGIHAERKSEGAISVFWTCRVYQILVWNEWWIDWLIDWLKWGRQTGLRVVSCLLRATNSGSLCLSRAGRREPRNHKRNEMERK